MASGRAGQGVDSVGNIVENGFGGIGMTRWVWEDGEMEEKGGVGIGVDFLW